MHKSGAKLYVNDINQEATKRVVSEFNATPVVDKKEFYGLDVDVYSPCAMGATVNDATLPLFKCKVIAGAANNQLLEEHKHGESLIKAGILYAPDYVINAGGLIHASSEVFGGGQDSITNQVENIYHTLSSIFDIADTNKVQTHKVAREMAEKRIKDISATKNIYIGDK